MKSVVNLIEIKSAIDFINEDNINNYNHSKKQIDKCDLVLVDNDEIKNSILMCIPIKKTSNKMWILLFPEINKLEYVLSYETIKLIN